MKANRLADYAARIDRAVALLEAGLKADEVPDLEALARAAAVSRFHFHRIFRLMTGESVQAMVRRLRLAKGSAALDDGSVTQAAGEAAYASTQAFARAMRAATGLSASEAKRTEARAALFAAPDRGGPLAIEMVSREPFELLAIRKTGDFAELNDTYWQLFGIAGGAETVTGLYGIQHSDPRFDAPETCVYDAALTLNAFPGETRPAHREIWGGGRSLRLRHIGSHEAIPAALDALVLEALAREDASLRDAPAFIHYLDDPEEVEEPELRSDLYLPVEEIAR